MDQDMEPHDLPLVLRITAPTFIAAVVFDDSNRAVRFPPIVNYMKGWTLKAVIAYCGRRRWRWETLDGRNVGEA